MKKSVVNSEKAPAAIGPYSHAALAGDLIFVSGQLPINAEGVLVLDDVSKATEACMENIKKILQAAGSSMEQCLKLSIFLTDMGDFAKVNEVYGRYFDKDYPARACVQVAALPKGAHVEIEAIAVR